MLTEQERQKAIHVLTKTRQTLLDAVEGVTENQARWKPAPDRWCILEYVEHLAVSDDGLVQIVRKCLQTPAKTETEDERRERENKIRGTQIPRGVNQAPHTLRPSGRFQSLPDAVAAFLAARERTMQYATTTQDDLRSHFSPHPVLGDLDAYQWLTGNAHHAETHASHIREIKELGGFPSN
jgi:DinB superfamily